jgi:hypothetical protein
MNRIWMTVAFASALLIAGAGVPQPAAAAHHEPVIMAITVNVEPGEVEEYRERVGKLNGIMKRLGVAGTVRMWRPQFAGPAAGNVLVGIEYPNSAAWAAAQSVIQADSEYSKIIRGLDNIRTIVNSGLWTDITPANVTPGRASGPVLAITAVDVKPGKLEDYRKRVSEAQGIVERLGISMRLRMWRATIAGQNTGAVVIGFEYSDLNTFVSDRTKMQADAGWRRFIASLDALRTLGGTTLYQEITP